MNVNVDKKELEKALFLAQGIVEKKSTYAVLSNVLLISENSDTLAIRATNLEIGIEKKIKAEVERSGAVSVQGDLIYKLVKESNADKIIFKETEEGVQGITNTGDFNIVKADPEEFPKLPEVNLSNLYSINNQLLQTLISKTIFAASPDETRYQINGVFFKFRKKEEKSSRNYLESVATDGHRLSLARYTYEGDMEILASGIIAPKKGLIELKKALQQMSDNVGIDVQNGLLAVKGDDTIFTMRLVEGKFPDYEAVFPQAYKTVFEIEKEDLLGAIRRVEPILPKSLNSVWLNFKEDGIKVWSKSPDTGLGEEFVSMKIIEGSGDLEVVFNAKYIQEALAVFDARVVRMKGNDEQSAWVLDSEEDPGVLQIIMPMKI